MDDVFLSYSRRDQTKAIELKQRIEDLGFSVWLDSEDIRGGHLWRAQIVEAIENCRLYTIALTTHSIVSDNVRRELDLARAKHKPILPIRAQRGPLDISREMEYQLVGLQIVPLEEMFEAHAGTLLEYLMRIPETLIMPLAAVSDAACLQNEEGEVISLDRNGQLIGRGSAADIDLTQWDRNRFVSQRHAELMCRDGEWQLSVCDVAQNPTKVNDKVVAKSDQVALKDGDRLTFADVTFRFIAPR